MSRADLAVVVIGLVGGQLAFGRPRRLGRAARPASTPPVTVVIPARDEAATLPLLLDDLTRDREPGHHVVVVDDHSTDGTAAVASRFPGVEVIAAPPVPGDWLPKSWACHHGASRAAEDGIVCFLDADVRVAPGAVQAVADEVDRRGGLVSVVPFHTVERPHEQLSALFNVVAVMGSGAGRRRPTGAFGPVLASTVADYRAVGGHAAVADQLVEDLALARRYRRAGLGVSLRAGDDQARWRMYPTSLRDLWDGWSKNFATGAGSTRPAALAAVALWITALTTVSLGWLGTGPLGDAGLAAITVVSATIVVQLRWFFRRVGDFAWWATLAFPLLVAMFLATFLRSLVLTVAGGSVRWRGRRLPVRATGSSVLRR